jgi:hypothetical protein
MTSVTLRKFSGHIAQCRDCEHFHAETYGLGDSVTKNVCNCPCNETPMRTVKPSYICKCAHFKICEGQQR